MTIETAIIRCEVSIRPSALSVSVISPNTDFLWICITQRYYCQTLIIKDLNIFEEFSDFASYE